MEAYVSKGIDTRKLVLLFEKDGTFEYDWVKSLRKNAP